jgi:hypothetical protein
MIIRKIKKNEIVSRKKLMKWLVIAIVVIVIGKGMVSWVNKEAATLIDLKPEQVGETVKIQ